MSVIILYVKRARLHATTATSGANSNHHLIVGSQDSHFVPLADALRAQRVNYCYLRGGGMALTPPESRGDGCSHLPAEARGGGTQCLRENTMGSPGWGITSLLVHSFCLELDSSSLCSITTPQAAFLAIPCSLDSSPRRALQRAMAQMQQRPEHTATDCGSYFCWALTWLSGGMAFPRCCPTLSPYF